MRLRELSEHDLFKDEISEDKESRSTENRNCRSEIRMPYRVSQYKLIGDGPSTMIPATSSM
jgi:hypothetical protein